MPYTLVVHSGLGSIAAEAVFVPARKAQALRAVGAVVVDDYTHASVLEEAALVYPSAAAIAPAGVRGRFHDHLSVAGLAVLIADEQLATAAQLLADGLPVDQATTAARQLCP